MVICGHGGVVVIDDAVLEVESIQDLELRQQANDAVQRLVDAARDGRMDRMVEAMGDYAAIRRQEATTH